METSFLKNSITQRHFIYLLLFSALTAIALTAMQLHANYQRDMFHVNQKIELLRVTNMDRIKASLLSFNKRELALQLEGMLLGSDIVHIEVKDDQGRVVAQAGLAPEQDVLTQDFPIMELDRGQLNNIGTLEISASLSGVYEQLRATCVVIFISQAFNIFLLSLLLLLVFQWLVNRDVVRLIHSINSIEPGDACRPVFHDDQPIVISPDTCSDLVTAITSMQKKMQLTLQVLERAQQVTNTGNWNWDVVRNITTWSKGLCRIVGITPEEYDGTYEMYLSCIHPDDKERFQALTQHIMKEKGPYHAEYRIVRKNDSAVRFVREAGMMTLDSDGNLSNILGTIQDITERKIAEESLRESEERFRSLVENVPGIVYRCQLKAPWHVELISEEVYTLTGYSQRDFLENRIVFGKLIVPEDLARVEKVVADCIASFIPYEVEYSLNHADGTIRYFHEKGRGVYDADRRPLWLDGVIIDITDRKRTEEEQAKLLKQLMHAQKSEAIGTLAGGIAHDFNNILAAIMGYTELVLLDLPQDSQNYKNLKQVYTASTRGRELIRQILTFSRTNEENRMPQNLGLIVKEALRLLRSSLPTSIEIAQDIDAECGEIMADATQLHQIIMNLGTNAFHAMEEHGGLLSIALHQVHLGEDELGRPHPPGDYVCLTVRDTGGGIPQADLERIFEPYYTTKKQGKGTGLGLALVQGIVNSHNGMLFLKSIEGEGTIFALYFPVIRADIKVLQQEDCAEVLSGGTGNILVVDDEAPIGEMVKAMLETVGYSVTLFTSSLDAAYHFAKEPEAFDLLITDQTMPGLTGLELIQKVLQRRPDLPVMLCTGYSSQVSTENYLKKGIRKLLMKPVDRNTLVRGVGELLAGR